MLGFQLLFFLLISSPSSLALTPTYPGWSGAYISAQGHMSLKEHLTHRIRGDVKCARAFVHLCVVLHMQTVSLQRAVWLWYLSAHTAMSRHRCLSSWSDSHIVLPVVGI